MVTPLIFTSTTRFSFDYIEGCWRPYTKDRIITAFVFYPIIGRLFDRSGYGVWDVLRHHEPRKQMPGMDFQHAVSLLDKAGLQRSKQSFMEDDLCDHFPHILVVPTDEIKPLIDLFGAALQAVPGSCGLVFSPRTHVKPPAGSFSPSIPRT